AQRFPAFRHVLPEANASELVSPHTLARTKAQNNSHPPSPAADELPQIPGYEVLGVIARGGMGLIYKARHVRLRRVVALKMLLAGAHAGKQELGRFRMEAEAVARLQHPSIVQIYEINEHNGLPFLALEFVPGGSLDQKLLEGPLPPFAAARFVERLA